MLSDHLKSWTNERFQGLEEGFEGYIQRLHPTSSIFINFVCWQTTKHYIWKNDFTAHCFLHAHSITHMEGFKFKKTIFLKKRKIRWGNYSTRYYSISHYNLNNVNWLLEEMKRSTEQTRESRNRCKVIRKIVI